MKIIKLIGVVAVLVIGNPYQARAEEMVLFNGGSPNGTTGARVSDIGFKVAAADLQLVNDSEVTKAEFWTSEFSGSFQWDGTIKYFVFVDLNGMPFNGPIFSGDGVLVTKERDTNADCCGNASGFKYTFEFDPPLMLQSDVVYWLATNLPGGGTINTVQAFWASTGATFMQGGAGTGDPDFSVPWRIFNFELAFRLLGHPAIVIPVVIDIMPGSPENTINVGSPGVLPVAILSSQDLDATEVNPETIFLSSAPVRFAGQSGSPLCQERDVNGDGLTDLVCNVETATFMDLGEAEAELTAETFEGEPIVGTDIIRVVP